MFEASVFLLIEMDEIGLAPELELPSTPVGESYAAQWTEKHKQVTALVNLLLI